MIVKDTCNWYGQEFEDLYTPINGQFLTRSTSAKGA